MASENDETDKFWINLHNVKAGNEYKYRDITTGVIKKLVLPFSNGEAERVFSATTLYKSGRRSGISTDLLEAMLYCKFGIIWLGLQKLSDFIPPLEILNYNSSLLYSYQTRTTE